jgi:hypothetical protein
MICKPEAVVIRFPAAWANALVDTVMGIEIAAAKTAKADLMMVRREERIVSSSVERPIS